MVSGLRSSALVTDKTLGTVLSFVRQVDKTMSEEGFRIIALLARLGHHNNFLQNSLINFGFVSFSLAFSLLCDIRYATSDEELSGEPIHY